LSQTFLILRRTERDMIKKCINIRVIRYPCQILMKLESSRQACMF